ncbi:MAG: ligase-associated DNA damage response endonuclease PdeM [Taibaiella sp.]|nr:ligase-associated DNA damage response endonuclease PdeM [Taibaiella sp.]
MTLKEQTIAFADENFTLTNQRAMFWEKHRMLILSDLHLGKAAHFRKSGIALPRQVSVDDLERLAQLVKYFDACRVLVVGDLIHAGANKEVALFRNFTEEHMDIRFLLVRGNHDRLSTARLNELGIREVYEELIIDGIHFRHHAAVPGQHYTISGHVHPGISVLMPARRTMRFPCYVVTATQIILPAFAKFTGLDTRTFPKPAVCYAIDEDNIFDIRCTD